MALESSILVPATPASALVFGYGLGSVSAADLKAPLWVDAPDNGERTLHLERLRRHQAQGFSYDLSGPNCVFRWARVPAGYTGPVDVVVHFHGYKGHNAMRLADKAAASGVDLRAPGVGRPTLGLIPHGQAFHSKSQKGVDGFHFPQIASQAQLDAFIDEALTAWAAQPGCGRLTRGRVILTGHSGGGAALTKLMQSIGTQPGVVGFQFFDGTYGGQQTLTARHNWIETALERDAAALAGLSNDDARRRYLQAEGSHLRICFIDGSPTAGVAHATHRFIAERLRALVPDEALCELLRARFRAQKMVRPKEQHHNVIPRTFGGRLLADAGNDLAPEAQDLPAPRLATGHAYEEDWDDIGEAAALDADTDAEALASVTLTRHRAADAPTGPDFIASLGSRKGVERENRIFDQIRAGNMPGSVLTFHPVRTTAKDKAGESYEIEYYVTPDYLAIGPEGDSVRIPMDPVTAQRVADLYDCLLPTARMVEQTYQAAKVQLTFIYGGYAGTPRAHLQDASSSYLDHHRAIEAKLNRPSMVLTSGHKKELVISNSYIRTRRNKKTGEVKQVPTLAFYGAYTAKGVPQQAGAGVRGMPSFAHEPSFVDYSHGVRLVRPTMKIRGVEWKVADVLRDPNLSFLISAEGPIKEPRYTLDRAGRRAGAQAQAASSEDPLGLAYDTWTIGALGYGSTWDARIRRTVEDFLAGYRAIPVQIGSQTVAVHPPYFMNALPGAAENTQKRYDRAQAHRAAAPAALRSLINERRFATLRIGKGTKTQVCELLQAADQAGLLQADPRVAGNPTSESLRRFLTHYGLGIDCSGFVGQAINKLIDLFPNAPASARLANPLETGSGSLKGGVGHFEKVTDPAQLCAGDTMWLKGHIRILAWAERRGDRIVFCTAESRSSNPADIGPAVAYWRLVKEANAGNENFRGWRLYRSFDLDAPDSGWVVNRNTHVYGHYKPLRQLLTQSGVTPVALESPPPLPSASRQAPPPPPPSTQAPVAGGTPAAAPPRTAVTRDLTQAEIDRLAAIKFRNAADVQAFFQRSGQGGFIDWYNAGLAHSKPFKARGRTETSRLARDRYTTFWNQIQTAFDRAEITALDFAAFTAISINETGGHLWARPELGGKGRSDASGRHPALAYFFDRIMLKLDEKTGKEHWKASYNKMRGARSAGELFNDSQFIDAHRSLAGADRLAGHGDDFGGAWKGSRYPQSEFDTAEDPAINGFIMQADFYKFRGRGVIQTTGRASYKRVVGFIQSYGGSNPVLADYRQRWANLTTDVACTRSRTEDWDRIFGESEMLAKGLALHAGTKNDYRRMSTQAATLLHVPQPTAKDGNPTGTTGSIYAMGRRISGARAYGAGIYRDRVLALLHGILTI